MVIITVLFVMLYHWRFSAWPGFYLPMTWLLELWILLSYVVGRYIQPSVTASFSLLAALRDTAIVTVLSGLLYLAYNWFAHQALGQLDTRNFLLPLLLSIAVVSFAAQLSLDRLVARRYARPLRWMSLSGSALTEALEQWSQ